MGVTYLRFVYNCVVFLQRVHAYTDSSDTVHKTVALPLGVAVRGLSNLSPSACTLFKTCSTPSQDIMLPLA